MGRTGTLAIHHFAIGNGQKFAERERILWVKPRGAYAERKLVGSEHIAIHQRDGVIEALHNGIASFSSAALCENGKFIAADASNDVRLAKGHF